MNKYHRGTYAVTVIFLFLSSQAAYSQARPHAYNGILDAREWNFSTKLPLNGYWNFFENKLLDPIECNNSKHVTSYFPSLWNDNYPTGTGCGTYYITVLLPPSLKEKLSIEIPQLYSCYSLWANGEKVAANGVAGKSREESVPQWRPQVVTLTTPTDTLTIVLQISNFHHHKGGAREPIYLGPAKSMNRDRQIAITSSYFETVVLAGAVIFLFVMYKRRREKAILYFAMLALTWAVRSMFSNLYTFIQIFPDFSWTWAIRIEYFTIYFSSIFAVLFLDELFGSGSNPLMKYILITANFLFVVVTIFSPPLFFTRWLTVYLIFSGITLAYGVIFIIRATVNEQIGVWFLVASLLLGIIMFSYDLMSYQGMFSYKPVVLNTGYLLIFTLTAIALLLHLGVVKSKRPRSGTMLTYGDLFGNEAKR